MTFTEALSSVFNDGDLITREVWNQRAEIGLDDGKLSINGYMGENGKWVGDGKWRAWYVTEEDFFASDWEVVN